MVGAGKTSAQTPLRLKSAYRHSLFSPVYCSSIRAQSYIPGWNFFPARGVTCYFSKTFSITYAPTWVRKFSQKCPAPHGSVFLLTTADRGNTLCLPLPGLRVLFSESRYHNFDVQFKTIFFLRPKNIVPGSDSDIILVVKWNDYDVLNPNLRPV